MFEKGSKITITTKQLNQFKGVLERYGEDNNVLLTNVRRSHAFAPFAPEQFLPTAWILSKAIVSVTRDCTANLDELITPLTAPTMPQAMPNENAVHTTGQALSSNLALQTADSAAGGHQANRNVEESDEQTPIAALAKCHLEDRK